MINRDEVISLLRDLVAIKSPYFQEDDIMKYGFSWFKENGIDGKLHEYEDSKVTKAKGKNLVVKIKGKRAGHKISINGHLDTVLESEGWSKDMYGKLEGNKFYGIGALDMKSGCVASMIAIKEFVKNHKDFSGEIVSTYVSVEEGPFGLGTNALIEDNVIGDSYATISMEPSAGFTDMPFPNLCLGARGGFGIEINVFGRAAHAACPEQGVNAVLDASKIICQLEEMELKEDDALGKGSICVVDMETKGSACSVPEYTNIKIFRHIVRGENKETIKKELEQAIEKANIQSTYQVKFREAPSEESDGFLPYVISEESEIVKDFIEISEKVCGKKATIGYFSSIGDFNYLATRSNTSLLIFGPAGENFHSKDEFVYVNSVVETAEILYKYLEKKLLKEEDIAMEKLLDIKFINGNVITMEGEKHRAESLGVKDGKIVFVGTNTQGKKFHTKEEIDLKGKTVLPGFVDSHMHLYAYCQSLTFVNLEGAKSISEVVSRIRDFAKNVEKGQWIRGANFDETNFKEKRLPTKEDLDKVGNCHPIAIRRSCLHIMVVNSQALEMAGIGQDFSNLTGGVVELDQKGFPTGVIKEQASKIIDKIMPDPLMGREAKKKALVKVFKHMSSKGITEIHTYAAEIWKYMEDITLYRELAKEGKLPVRVVVYLDKLFEKKQLSRREINNPYNFVKQGGFKLFTDGYLGGRSAALEEPYSDDENNMGITVCSKEELNKSAKEAYKRNLQLAIHAIGDRGLDMALTAMEESLKEGIIKEALPFRLIHGQLINASLLNRMKKLPLVVDIQPSFLCTDLHWINDRVGENRGKNSYNWKTIKKAGIIETGSSDCPVESYDPLLGIYGAVTRADFSGYPENGYLPDERLTMYEALELFVKNAHYAVNEEDFLGLIREGYFADFIILDRNISKARKKEILNVKILETYLAGKKVF